MGNVVSHIVANSDRNTKILHVSDNLHIHIHNALGKLPTREMTECSLQSSQASTAADKTSASASAVCA